MKVSIVLLGLSVVVSLTAAEKPALRTSLYDKGYTVSAFALTKTTDMDRFSNGAGVGVGYFINRYIGFEGQVFSFDLDHGFVDQFDVSLVGRLPVNRTPLALYAFSGGGYNFEEETYDVHQGIGAEFKFTHSFGAFIDAGWYFPIQDNRQDYGLFRGGLKFNF